MCMGERNFQVTNVSSGNLRIYGEATTNDWNIFRNDRSFSDRETSLPDYDNP